MGEISVLISGKDREYNQALAAAMQTDQRDFVPVCVSPRRLEEGGVNLMNQYDAVLLEDVIAEHLEGVKAKVLLLQNLRFPEERDEWGYRCLFKYQKWIRLAEAVAAEVGGDKRKKIPCGQAKIIGFADLTGNGNSAWAAEMTAKALSMKKKKVLFCNLEEFPGARRFHAEAEGVRSWDDFIYCCVYGKTVDMLSRPEAFSSVEESGVLYFPQKRGRNPFSGLEQDEVELFFAALRERLSGDFSVTVLPGEDSPQFFSAAEAAELLVMVTDGNHAGEEQKERIMKNLREHRGFRGKTVTLGIGGRRDRSSKCDFAVSVSENQKGLSLEEFRDTETWKAIEGFAGYINDGCFA